MLKYFVPSDQTVKIIEIVHSKVFSSLREPSCPPKAIFPQIILNWYLWAYLR